MRALFTRVRPRRGTAIIVVMMLVLFFTSTTLVLLGSTQTSMAQARGNVAKSQANSIMDAGAQLVLGEINNGQLATGDSSGGYLPLGQGEFSYTISAVPNDAAGKFRLVDVTARVQTGVDANSQPLYTDSTVQMTVEIIPKDVGVPGALTIDSTNGGQGGTIDGNNLNVDYNGKPGTVSGQDYDDVSLLPADPAKVVAGVAITSLETELSTDPSGTLISAFKTSDSGKATLYGTPVVDPEATPPDPQLLEAVRTASTTTTSVISADGSYGVASLGPGGFGTPDAPKVVFVNLADGSQGVNLSGIGDGYGVIYVKCDNPNLTGHTLLTLSGATYWHGLVYVETGEANATDVNGSTATNGTKPAVFSIRGQSKVLGGVVIGAMNEWEYANDNSTHIIASIAGGGTGTNLVYSTSGLKYASRALNQIESVTIRSYRVVTGLAN